MIIVNEKPQYSNNKISYSISGDTLTITVNGVIDLIDFSQFPDGEASVGDIETSLPTNPILGIKKINGDTTVELFRFYGDDEKEVFESGYNKMEIPFGFFG